MLCAPVASSLISLLLRCFSSQSELFSHHQKVTQNFDTFTLNRISDIQIHFGALTQGVIQTKNDFKLSQSSKLEVFL